MKLFKVLLLGMVLAFMATPIVAFADEVEINEWLDHRLDQVLEFTPDTLDEWTRLFGSKDLLKEEREVLKEELYLAIDLYWQPYIDDLKATVKENLQAYRELLKTDVEAGQLTQEEALILYQDYAIEERAELEIIKDDRQAEKVAREEEIIYYESLRENRKMMNESIKIILENGGTEGIAENLNSILLINQELEIHAIDVNLKITDKTNELNEL